MGLFSRKPKVEPDKSPATSRFAVDIPPEFFGLTAYSTPISPAQAIDRRAAMQCAAVTGAVSRIAGPLSTLPLTYLDGSGVENRSPLFEQPEANVPRSVTMRKTIEDLIYHGLAWWQILASDYRGYPTSVVRLDPRTVSVELDAKVYVTKQGHTGMARQWLQDGEYIQFLSPSEPLLEAGARAIRTCLQLDASAAKYAEGWQPLDYFTPAGDAEPFADDDEVRAFLAQNKINREAGSTAYYGAQVQHHTNGWNPEQLQLADARQHAVLEIARLTGVDAEDLGVSTTSRTYFNSQDRQRQFVNGPLSSYMRAVEDRLSMGDVTPRGYRAAFDLTDLLKADDATRMTVAVQGLAANILSQPEARAVWGAPNVDTSDADLTPTLEDTNVVEVAFDSETGAETFFSLATDTFSVDENSRTVSGLILPYGKAAVPGNGTTPHQYGPGSVKWDKDQTSKVKLLVSHDPSSAVGHAKELTETPDGLHGTFKVARGAEGDRVISMAQDKVYDGFSVGLGNGHYELRDGVRHAVSVPLVETSVTPFPAFDSARLTSVAASAVDSEVKMENTQTPEAPAAPAAVEAPADFAQAIKDGLAAGFAAMAEQNAKPVIPAQRTQVGNEPSLYRFDGFANEHDFSTDLFAAIRERNSEARQRVDQFFASFAATDSGDVSDLTPAGYRPDLYVSPVNTKTPVADAILRGGLTNGTPFVVPTFGSSSGMVSAHTEGTEPDDGTFTADSETVTPSALSGKMEITREVIDAGGSPQVSGLIWAEIQRQWDIAKETAAAGVLAGFTTELGTAITAGVSDAVLAAALQGNLAGLAFSNYTFTNVAAHVDLYTKLLAAKDGSNRPLFPQLAPQNANGTSASKYASVNVAGYDFTPAGSLGVSGTNKKSYIFDPSGVAFWMSAPTRIALPDTVATAGNIGLFGYKAGAILDANRGFKMTYSLS